MERIFLHDYGIKGIIFCTILKYNCWKKKEREWEKERKRKPVFIPRCDFHDPKQHSWLIIFPHVDWHLAELTWLALLNLERHFFADPNNLFVDFTQANLLTEFLALIFKWNANCTASVCVYKRFVSVGSLAWDQFSGRLVGLQHFRSRENE